MKNDYENKKASRCRKNSPAADEDCTSEMPFGGSTLKKGPWTSAEDAVLVEYVTKHGEGNWNAVQKHSGLSRCGKSCRLRWANHLRPDLKKGAFTVEEEARIIELHSKMGNKWARMATELPGRTDNEIKNYWNTRIKRLQRAGLPVYPPEMCLLAMNESQQSDDMITEDEDNHGSDPAQTNGFDIPDVEFKNLELNQELLKCSPALLDIPRVNSRTYSYMFPTVNPHKRLREMETQFHGSVARSSSFSSFDQYEDELFARLPSVWLWSPPSHDPDLNIDFSSPVDVPSSHAAINGNSSSSEPNSKAMKLELPSLQYSASQVGGWVTPSSPLPSLESVDTLIQSPVSEHTQSTCPSPQCSGLLEAIVFEAQSKNSNSNSSHPFSEASFMTGDGVESSSRNVCNTEWNGCGDPASPLCKSAAIFFVDSTPGGGSSSAQSAQTVPGSNTKPKAVEWASTDSDGKEDISCPLENLRPDALLDSFCFGHRIARFREQSFTGDIETLDENLTCDYKQGGALPSESYNSSAPESCTWDNLLLSPVCSLLKDDFE